MAHHLKGFDYSFCYETRNIILIRNPRQLINSFAKVISNPVMEDIAIKREYELYEELSERGKLEPLVLDSGEILNDPEKVLKKLCQQIEIPFTKKMLSWKAGPRKEDGIWAKYWYRNVHNSTHFVRQKDSEAPLMEDFRDLYNEAMPYYNYLYERSLKA